MRRFRDTVLDCTASALNSLLPQGADQPPLELEIPPRPELGDIAIPCFRFARALRKAPAQIAQDLAAAIELPEWVERTEVVGSYVNLFLHKPTLVHRAVLAVGGAGDLYGESDAGGGKKVVIDFSSPNIAKPFGIHHLRTTVLGHALARIFSALGYDVVRINHLGDWGTQFGKLMVAYQRWGDPDRVKANPIEELLKLYVRFTSEADVNPVLEEEGRAWFSRLERGDAEAQTLWQKFRDWSVRDFQRVYSRMGIAFDSYAGESFYNDKMDAVVDRLEAAGILEESEGALMVPLPDLPPCLIRKSDQASLYATRDLAAALYRWERYRFDHMLYVVANQQQLHFQQVFAVLRKLGCEWVDRCEHVGFGWVTWGGQAMSTRKGHIVLLEQVIDEAMSRALAIIEERTPKMPEKEQVAESIGLAGVAFGMLAYNRNKDISFSWEAALNFDGDTGPYVQYTHARACSVLRKSARAGEEIREWSQSPPPPSSPAQSQVPLQGRPTRDQLPNGSPPEAPPAGDQAPLRRLHGHSSFETPASVESPDWGRAVSPQEVELAKLLLRYPEAVETAATVRDPSAIAHYLLELSQSFNVFYHVHRIVGSEAEKERLCLTEACRQVIKNGLNLLGLTAPVEM